MIAFELAFCATKLIEYTSSATEVSNCAGVDKEYTIGSQGMVYITLNDLLSDAHPLAAILILF